MKTLTIVALVLAAALSVTTPAVAGIPGKVLQETTEFLFKKFGREVAQEGSEKLAARLASAAARHGDDVLTAVRKVGPKALELADEAGENAPRLIRFLSRHGDDGLRVVSHPQGMALFSRFGDEAAEVLVRHQGVAGPVLERLGEPAVKALGVLGPRAGRRMGMLASDLSGSGHAPELMSVITRYGDPALEFLWRHKGILAGGAALAAFLADPEPYLNGTADIARVAGEGATEMSRVVASEMVKPAIVAAGNVAVETVDRALPLMLMVLAGVALTLGLAIKGGVLKSLPVKLAFRLAGKKAAHSLFRKG